MKKHLCIHGHFYQPPRENPWLETVEVQDSAYPYHDWNERITAECYAPNTASRILDSKGLIKKIINNYSRMSFNMGPTLLSWLQEQSPTTYEAILEADRLGASRRSGHGPAMAQAYSHLIMPLASKRDIQTQVHWGIRDFHYRFKRDPEGMWLPETAVDTASLEAMAEHGIKFTVLAPHQAHKTRPMNSDNWLLPDGGEVDPTRPYKCTLPSGRSITLFFYNGKVSQAIAFEGLLKSGDEMAKRLLGAFPTNGHGEVDEPRLMHIATDGESYGHHHHFGDMALAYALNYIEDNGLATVTNYAQYLADHPPTYEAEIVERTSWSCIHGVERWQSDCGCSSGAHPSWNQNWRAPLRQSLDWLRDTIKDKWEQDAAKVFKSPWDARDAYINIILDRSADNIKNFMATHAIRGADEPDQSRALALLEIQRNAQLMYTSCGWFFDDISGIETVQILNYAARVIQLCSKVIRLSLQDEFTGKLKDAMSNLKELGSGADIYNNKVMPSIVSMAQVAAHFAISSLFEQFGQRQSIYSYNITPLDYARHEAGGTEFLMARCRITSRVTGKARNFRLALLYLGGHDFNVSVCQCKDIATYRNISEELTAIFRDGAFADLVRAMDKHFGDHAYNLRDLFRDEQRQILENLTQDSNADFEESYRRLYEDNVFLMGFIKETGMPVSRYFLTAAEYTLNMDLSRMLAADAKAEAVGSLVAEMTRWGIATDSVPLEYSFRKTIEREMLDLSESPRDLPRLVNVTRLISLAQDIPFSLNLWQVQNTYHTLARRFYAGMEKEAELGEAEARAWIESFEVLGIKLGINPSAIILPDSINGDSK